MEFAVHLSQRLDPAVLDGWMVRDWVHLDIGDVTTALRRATWMQGLWVDVLADEDDDTEAMAAEVTELARLVADAVTGDFEFLLNGDTEVCARKNGRMRYGHHESDGWWGDRFRAALRAAA